MKTVRADQHAPAHIHMISKNRTISAGDNSTRNMQNKINQVSMSLLHRQ